MKIDIYNTEKKYNIIYADPPWQYTKKLVNRGKARAVEKEYQTMSFEKLCEMKEVINNISNNNSLLFMWVTFPKLELGLRLIQEWGFKYKTCAFTWIKKNKKSDSLFWGMGFYTRANAEICLVASKGKGVKIQSHKVHQIIQSRIEEHSKKPDIVREKIIELIGDLPRIELFARQYANGWDCWGNEV